MGPAVVTHDPLRVKESRCDLESILKILVIECWYFNLCFRDKIKFNEFSFQITETLSHKENNAK